MSGFDPYEHSFRPSPEWVMAGLTQPHGVVVFASKDLRDVELQRPVQRPAEGRWRLIADCGSVDWSTDDDYGAAIRRLFRFWTPPSRGPVPLIDVLREELDP